MRTVTETISQERRELAADVRRLGSDWATDEARVRRRWLVTLRDAGLIAEQVILGAELDALVEMHRLVRVRLSRMSN